VTPSDSFSAQQLPAAGSRASPRGAVAGGAAETQPPAGQAGRQDAAGPVPHGGGADVEPGFTEIAPPSRRFALGWGELWRARELVLFLAWRDVRVRYRQTLLGALWAVLQPALLLGVFWLVVGRLQGAAAPVPYAVFALAGLVPWTFFAAAVSSAAGSVVASERLVTRVYFPRMAIPWGAVAAAAVDFACGVPLLVAVCAWHGTWPGWWAVALPGAVAGMLAAALGAGTCLAAANVAYRDVRYVLPFLLQIWMLATPAIYLPQAAAPGGFSWWWGLNPMQGLVMAFRGALLGLPVSWEVVGTSAAISLVLLVGGSMYFRRVEEAFADVI
jgi:lipopolysaccharide transport system permease protein